MDYFKLPYPMKFSWDGKNVTKIGCHYLIAAPLENAHTERYKKIGLSGCKDYGLNLYAGCYAPRKSRGRNSLGDHSWGIACDLNPDANGLRQVWKPGAKASNGTKRPS